MPEQRRGTRWRAPDEPCLNCGDSTPGNYCPTCGQRKALVLVSVRALLADVLEDQLVLNRALPRTLFALFFRPGFLTAEYVRGRIVRYIAPFRLYLVASVLFFLVLSFFGLDTIQNVTVDDEDAVAASTEASTDALRESQAELAAVDTMELDAEGRAAVRDALRATGALVAAGAGADTTAQAPADTEGESPDSAAAAQSEAERIAELKARHPQRPDNLQPWAYEVDLNSPWPWMKQAMERKLAQVGHLPPREAGREVTRDLLEYAPHMVFLLLPVFAFLLKLLYIRRSRFYAEHFVFALHVHAFVFVTFLLMFAVPWGWVDALFMLWMVVYIWLAMRRVYEQGWFRTTVKWWVLGWTYLFVFVFGIVGLSIATLVLT